MPSETSVLSDIELQSLETKVPPGVCVTGHECGPQSIIIEADREAY